MLVAIGHIGGSIVVTMAFGALVLVISSWELRRNEKNLLEEMAIRVGVSADELRKAEFAPKLIEISSQRFSSDLLRNRLSDLCGVLRTIWDVTSSILQLGVLLGVIWFTATDSLANAVYAWSVPAIAFFFWIAAVLFALTCRLLTGRYPGEAKLGRKAAADYLKQRRSFEATACESPQ